MLRKVDTYKVMLGSEEIEGRMDMSMAIELAYRLNMDIGRGHFVVKEEQTGHIHQGSKENNRSQVTVIYTK